MCDERLAFLRSISPPADRASPATRARCTAWAAKQLGVSEKIPLESLRSAFWTRLEQENFLPPEKMREAVDHLASVAQSESPSELPEDFWEAEEIRLCREVDGFARGMFRMPPRERKRRWEEIRAECEGTVWPLARCESLEAGLEADLAQVDVKDTGAVKLATHLCEMVSAVPSQRSQWRRRIRELWHDDPKQARRVARRFRRRYPQIAALDPLLLKELIAPPDSRRLITQVLPQRVKGAVGRTSSLYLKVFVFYLAITLVVLVFRSLPSTQKESPKMGYDVEQLQREWQQRKQEEARRRMWVEMLEHERKSPSSDRVRTEGEKTEDNREAIRKLLREIEERRNAGSNGKASGGTNREPPKIILPDKPTAPAAPPVPK